MAYDITSKCIGCGACLRICPTGAISGEKKERHSIDVAVCISCGACGKVCPSGAVEDPFGMVAPRVKRKEWPVPFFDTQKCMACVICTDSCPVGAISVGEPVGKDPNGYPFLAEPGACLGCGLCEADCPSGAIFLGAREAAA